MRQFVETVKGDRHPPRSVRNGCAAVLFVPVYFWWRCFADALIDDVVYVTVRSIDPSVVFDDRPSLIVDGHEPTVGLPTTVAVIGVPFVVLFVPTEIVAICDIAVAVPVHDLVFANVSAWP